VATPICRQAHRVRTMLSRQPDSRWLRDYDPAIHATRTEAPRTSRPRTVFSLKLGRCLHLLSPGEEAVALIVLHNPAVFDVHEQRMLHTEPTVHPLHNHPDHARVDLPAFRGTIAAADGLGLLRHHPRFTDPETGQQVPLPYVGDLLVFLQDEEGPHAINLNIKWQEVDFKRRGPGLFPRPRLAEDEGAKARLAIEEAYYADAGIRSVRIAAGAIHSEVRSNLHRLLLWHCRPIDLSPAVTAELIGYFERQIGTHNACWSLIQAGARRMRISDYTAKTVLFQAIWNRVLDVDLYKPILMDCPLQRATRDALHEYRHWFERTPT